MQDTTINTRESDPDGALAEWQGARIADALYVATESIQETYEQSSPFAAESAVEALATSKTFESLTLTGNVDLGEVELVITVQGSSKPIDADFAQVYLKREYTDENGSPVVKWHQWTPMDEKEQKNASFTIFPYGTQSFRFVTKLPLGRYSAARCIFFKAGFAIQADQGASVTPFEIVTTQIRIKKPLIEVDNSKVENPTADGKIRIPFVIKYPAETVTPSFGWWAMAKGAMGFKQKWVKYASKDSSGKIVRDPNTKVAEGPDPYWYNEGEFLFDTPEKSGIFNMQYGLFDNAWKETYHWVWPGTDIEVGGDSWIVKCPPHKLPPRLRVKNGQFVTLDGKPYNFYAGTTGGDAITALRGASWGNAYGWTTTPALNKSGFFGSLRYLGHRFCRFLFNPDWYSEDPVYRHRVLDSIHKILLGGLYPLVGPHNLHVDIKNNADRDQKFLDLCAMVAEDWKGLPVMYAIASEPKELTGGWAECKPLWEKAARIVRSIDPDAFIIVPCKGYSKTITTDEAADLLDRDLVDAYSYHPYHAANLALPNMKPLLDTGVGVIIEEYGCGQVAWQKSMNVEMQRLSRQYPNLLAFATWAWTSKGQDSCYMVEDGNLAEIALTAAGAMHAEDIAAWDRGELIDENGAVTPPPVTPPPVTDGGNTTDGGTSGGGTTTTDLSNYPTRAEVSKLVSDAVTVLSQKIDSLPKPLTREEIQGMIDAGGAIVDPTPAGDVSSQVMGVLQNLGLLSPDLDNRIANIVGMLLGDLEKRILGAMEDKLEEIGTIDSEAINAYIDAYLKTQVTALVLEPAKTFGESTVRGTVSISIPASRGGVVVALASSSAAAAAPQTVTVPEGATSASFVIRTTAVTAATQCAITATLANGLTSSVVKATLAINPLAVRSLSASPARLLGSKTTSCTVTLNAPAGEEGALVALSSSDPSATPPDSILVKAGASTAAFNVLTHAVAAQKNAVLSAAYNGTTRSCTLTVDAPTLQALSFSPNPAAQGQATTGKVTLNGPAPEGGLVVSLSSTVSFGLPDAVTVPAWASEAAFTVTPARGGISPTVMATLNGVNRTVTLKIA